MNEYSEIIKSHPGIVLTSENPVTWKGFLIVDPNLGFNIDIKLMVPHYPQLRDATLLFGRTIAQLYGTGFDEKIIKLLESSSSVSLLLLQLKRVVMNVMKNKLGNCSRDVTSLQHNIVSELEAALQLNSPVSIAASGRLNSVKLSLDNVAVTMQNDPHTDSWKVISSDLPELSCLEPFELNIGSLSDAVIKLQRQVDILVDAWNQLNDIDKQYNVGTNVSWKKTVLCINYDKSLVDEQLLAAYNNYKQSQPQQPERSSCWVVDPPQPKPYHLYRIVKLTPSLSALITINPTHVLVLPDIKLLGTDSEVAKYRNIMSSNLLKWDPDSSIADNLRILMAIEELPLPPEIEEPRDKTAIVESEECCICFSMELDDTSPPQLPVEICDNAKCRRHFHTTCLLQWLQSIAVNQVSFGRIHGTCLNCGEVISCSVRTN